MWIPHTSQKSSIDERGVFCAHPRLIKHAIIAHPNPANIVPITMMKALVLALLVSSTSAFGVFFTRPSRMMSKSADKAMVSYDQMHCDTVDNNNVICAPKPYQATKFDVMAGQLTGATTYLGEYPAPGAGSRWASKEKLGANCEEEYVNGELTFVCYVH